MSWGGSELPAKEPTTPTSNNQAWCTSPAPAYGAGVLYPAASPYVVSVGGTSLSYDLSNDVFQWKVIWQPHLGLLESVVDHWRYQSCDADLGRGCQL